MNITFGRYRLLERLGQGGMAEVFKAKSFGVEGFEKVLVIKRILPELAEMPEFVELFIREAKLAVRLSHANIVQVFDLGKAPGGDGFVLGQRRPDAYYMAMEYVHGVDLRAVLESARAEERPLPTNLAVFVASEIAKGLDHAHRRRDEQLRPLGIVHRDVSPANILLSFEGEVKVTDFGIAKARGLLAQEGIEQERLRGKFAYMSPEQARGAEVDARSDLFSLGIILYEALTGSQPFAAPTSGETLRRVIACEFPPPELLRPELPKALLTLLMRALAKDPNDRFSDAGQMYEALLAFLYAEGIRTGHHELAAFLSRHRERTARTSVIERVELEIEDPNELTPVEIPTRHATPTPPPGTIEPDALSQHGERRDVTIVYALASEQADAISSEAVRLMFSRYGGQATVDASLDVVGIFGLDEPDGRDTELAARAALVARRAEGERYGFGIHTGRIHVRQGGDPANDSRAKTLTEAARELSRTRRGACLLSATTERLLRASFVCELIDEPAHKSRGQTAFLIDIKSTKDGAGKFFGRREELRRIGETIAAATKRQIQVVTVRGDQGLGKTRLFQEVERRLDKGGYKVGVYRAECPPQGRALPLSAITSMIHTIAGIVEGDPFDRVSSVEPRLRALGLHADEVRAIVGQLGAIGGTPDSRGQLALRNAFARLIISLTEDRSCLLFWDSAHQFDDESGKFLEGLLPRIQKARVVLAFAGRGAFAHPLGGLELPSLLELVELSRAEAEEMIAARLGVTSAPPELTRFVFERSGGHPQFIEEIVKALVEGRAITIENGQITGTKLVGQDLTLPKTLRGLVAARIAKLSVEERACLQAAAIVGHRVEDGLLARVLGVELPQLEAALVGLVSHDLLVRSGPDELSFTSPFIQEVVLDMLTSDATATIHGAAARALEATFSGRHREIAERLADHLFHSGDRARAAQFFAESGSVHFAGGRFEQAARSYARALELADVAKVAAESVAGWLHHLAESVRSTGTCPDAEGLSSKAFEAADRHGEQRLRVQTRIDAAVIACALHRFERAKNYIFEAEKIAEGVDALAKNVLAAYAELATRQSDFNRAIAMLQRLQHIATSEGDAHEEHRLLLHQAQAHAGLGERQAALTALARAERLLPDDERAIFERQKQRAMTEYFSGHEKEALAEIEQAMLLARKLHLPHEIALGRQVSGMLLVRLEDHARAYGSLHEAIELADEGAFERISNYARMYVAFLDGLKGDLAAERLLRRGIAYAEASDFTGDALDGRYLLARLLLHRGHHEQAQEEFEDALERALDSGNQLLAGDCQKALERVRIAAEPRQ